VAQQAPIIVGIGASAGGLAAFKAFFASMPPDSGMAFVLVQHLDPNHRSLLVELVARQTAMPVEEAADGVPAAANHVFIIPPDATLTVRDGILRVVRPSPPRDRRMPIDALFMSLAEDQGENAVCIVLSGTGTDGTLGIRMVKEQGGLTLAQSEHDHLAMSGMPESAAATGLVDHVVPAGQMPALLADYRRTMILAAGSKDGDGTRRDAAEHIAAIASLLRARVGHDFGQYKPNTLVRRIQRRMQVLQIASVPEFIARLRAEPAQLDLLFRDLLIGVTGFFRDPPEFAALQSEAMAGVISGNGGRDGHVRVWVPACASGEEAYSIAILLREEMDRQGLAPNVQIFGTDIDEAAVAAARAGRYPKPLAGIAPERLERWFAEEGGAYRVTKPIREMCVFSVHSVIKDPPFSRLDLISCRNMLIYMSPGLQERVWHTFHYALRPGGTLFLGRSEGIPGGSALFAQPDAAFRLFRRLDTAKPVLPEFSRSSPAPPPVQTRDRGDAADCAERIAAAARCALEKHSPAHLVINERCEILQFSGGPSAIFLEPSAGAANLGLLSMVRKQLRPAVRAAVQKAFATRRPVIRERVPLRMDAGERAVSIIVEPLGGDSPPGLWAVAFRDLGGTVMAKSVKDRDEGGEAAVRVLEDELAATQEHLHTAVEEAEALAEEMKSAGEEYLSVNEELQASNEELETAKEEMQSVNEELQTINTELGCKNETLARLNSDMQNLLESTHIATIFLDSGMLIKGFTPAVADIFRLRAADLHRPITDIATTLAYSGLSLDVSRVMRDGLLIEREVEVGGGGPAFIMRIRPYTTAGGAADGVVITFVDITERKRAETVLREHAAIVEFSQDALVGINLDGTVRSWNPAAEKLFGYGPDDVLGGLVSLLAAAGRSAEQDAMFGHARTGEVAGPAETVCRRRDGTGVDVELTVMPIRSGGSVVALAAEASDISERKLADARRTLLRRELSHRVKNTLASVQSLAAETLRTAETLTGFRDVFLARLAALAKTHDILMRQRWEHAALRDVVEAELAPYQGSPDARWTAAGEDIQVLPDAALAFGMAFHELATNAAKYGAFSVAGGRVAVTWQKLGEDGVQRLHVLWAESGGPAVAEPPARGFGSRLIGGGVALALDGNVTLDFNPAGVRCGFDVPLDHLEVNREHVS
jgi:two-component system CheB/CheR fusion protein